MVAIAAVLTIVTISVLVTRVAATALETTGVSAELAHFQARSAFTGVGFTTSEAEAVVDHPVRRRIMLVLMLTGNAGLVSVVGAPDPEIELRPGDLAILYGREDDLAELERRRAGDPGERAHEQAVTRQRAAQADERSRDPAGR